MENQIEERRRSLDGGSLSGLQGKYHIGGGIKSPPKEDKDFFESVYDAATEKYSLPQSDYSYSPGPQSDYSYSPGPVPGEEKSTGQQVNYESVQHVNWAHHVRHSPIYLIFTLVSLILSTVLFVWVIITGPAVFKLAGYLVIECLILLSIAFNTIVDVSYVGGVYNYLCKPKTNLDYLETSNRFILFWHKYGLLVLNYVQLSILLAAIGSFIFTLTAYASAAEIEEEVALFLLLARYASYSLVLMMSQYRSVTLQGGIDTVFQNANFGSKRKSFSEDWDIQF